MGPDDRRTVTTDDIIMRVVKVCEYVWLANNWLLISSSNLLSTKHQAIVTAHEHNSVLHRQNDRLLYQDLVLGVVALCIVMSDCCVRW